MYSTQDCNELLYVKLRAALKSNVKPGYIAISGDVYFDDERPNSSTKEDVAINTPTISGQAIQQGYSNINVYVPTEKITTDSGGLRVRRRARERVIIKLIADAIEEMQTRDCYCYVQSQSEDESPDGEESFASVRVFWKILNR